MRTDWLIGAVALAVILAAMGMSGWWFLRGHDDTDDEDEQETQTWAVTDAGDRCLTCGDVIDWRDGGEDWIGHCACCADDHEDRPISWHNVGQANLHGLPELDDDAWAEVLHRMNTEPAGDYPSGLELVPTQVYVDLSDDPDLLEWDTRQQKARIADIRTHLAMLGAREATWYADRMATVGERLAA